MRGYNFYSKLKEDKFSLVYLGEFDDDLTGLLMRVQETSSKEERGIKKRVSYLIAECFQNIIRHSDSKEHTEDGKSKMFMMRKYHGTHYLASANPILNENIDSLKDSFQRLQNLSKDELRKIYLEALGQNKLSEKGGGGLGLIEMARKTGVPPQHHFEPLNDQFSNFFMQIVMKGEEAKNDPLQIADSVSLYEDMLKEHVVLLRKGDFSQESILPLFKLFESNLQIKKEDLVFKKKSLYILIELLQNMNRHAVSMNGSKEGLFIISMKNGEYTMETGNFIKKEKSHILKGHLDSLVGLDKIQLSKRYKQQLMDNSVREEEGAGIGIIEMFRQSDGEIMYNFTSVDEELDFFSLSATL